MTFSFSRLHSFENCKYEWYLNYILQDVYEKEPNFYATYGSLCHELIESILTGDKTYEEAIEYYSIMFDSNTNYEEVSENLKDKYFYDGLDYFANVNFDWIADYEILGVEKEYHFTFADYDFICFIDLLLQEKSTGNIIIVDHKSSAYPLGKTGKVLASSKDSYESYKKQLYVYSQAVYEEYGKYPTELCLNYFREQKWVQIPFNKQEFDETEEWAKDLIQEIEAEEEFLPEENYFYCRNLCEYRRSCEYITMGDDEE